MKIVHGNLIDLAEAGEFDVIIHGCNCFCKMKRGIAAEMVKRYPQVRTADNATKKGSQSKLGHYTGVNVGEFTIVNAYTQYHWDSRNINCDYDAIKDVFTRIAKDFGGLSIGYPMIGAGLARGKWEKIAPIIDETLAGLDHTLVIYDGK